MCPSRSTSFGANTEIVIPKRTNENKYQIIIQLPNLAPDTSSPDCIVFKTALEKGKVNSLLYTPLLIDNKGKWSYANSVKLLDKDVEDNIYTVEYSVDEKFLNDKNKKFSVILTNRFIYINPSNQIPQLMKIRAMWQVTICRHIFFWSIKHLRVGDGLMYAYAVFTF